MGELGVWQSGQRAAVQVCACLLAVCSLVSAAGGATAAELPSAGLPAPVQALVRWAAADGDAAGRPFAVVDKSAARVFVFASGGHLMGTSPVLLGLARGDESAPGVGTRVTAGIPHDQRTTPAGRFASEPGHNLHGEAIVWVDYAAAVAVHRLRPASPHERRPQRLASATPDDNRITLGCIVVDGAFYDAIVAPLLGRQRGVVYVLPDTQHWREVFRGAAGL